MRNYMLLLLMVSSIAAKAQQFKIVSPDGNIQVMAGLSASGEVSYTVHYKNKAVILPSSLGMKLKEPNVILNQFSLVKIDSSVYDQTWNTVWGEYSAIRDHHKELRLQLKDKGASNILLHIVFRVFNEGVGFRYEFPQQTNFTHFVLDEEMSQFHVTGDHKAFWIPGDYDTNEFKYNTSKLSQVDASSGKFVQEIHAKTFF